MEVQILSKINYKNVVRVEEDDDFISIALAPKLGQVAGLVIDLPKETVLNISTIITGPKNEGE